MPAPWANSPSCTPGRARRRSAWEPTLREVDPDLLERHLSRADELSGLPVSEYTSDGPMESLTRTDVAQPALFALSMAVDEVARAKRPQARLRGRAQPRRVHAPRWPRAPSTPSEGMRLVCERGRLMAGDRRGEPGRDGGDHRPGGGHARGALRRRLSPGIGVARQPQLAHPDRGLRRGGRRGPAAWSWRARRAPPRRCACRWARPSTAS